MEISPFRGWRYAGRDGDVSDFIAPPYDILSAADKQALLARSARNIVAVDMPHVPPKTLGPDAVYRDAAALLAQWKASGVLVQDSAPAIYAYEQTFHWAGKSFTRRALICGVRATAFGRDVIPHEQTFAGPKADRLRLTELTRMQLSPIFGFYDDPAGSVGKAAFAGTCCPKAFGRLGDVGEKLWVVNDPSVIQAVAKALRSVPVFIADGHHRYTTALAYRDHLKAAGLIDDEHEANFVMFALVARDDAGLMILPTHRMIGGLGDDFTIDKLRAAAPEFSWQKADITGASLDNADAFLQPFGGGAMAFVNQGATEMWIARLDNPEAMAEAAPDQSDAWRSLDVAILQKLIIEKALVPWRREGFTVEYSAYGRDVLAACRAGKSQLGVCLQSTPLSAVETIARAGQFMPHKSTYFYPKLATGMVLKPLV